MYWAVCTLQLKKAVVTPNIQIMDYEKIDIKQPITLLPI